MPGLFDNQSGKPVQSGLPVFDGHNDSLTARQSLLVKNDQGHIDFPRSLKGGLAGGLFALLVPPLPGSWGISDIVMTDTGYGGPVAPAIKQTYAEQWTIKKIADLKQLINEGKGSLRLIRTMDELSSSFVEPSLSIILHFEGAEAIDRELLLLDYFYQHGLRSLGIVWSRPNDFGHGVPFAFPSSPDTGPGLTDAGRALVKKCNKLGIMIDLAHLNEKGFWEVARLTDKPLVVSHSAAHALCPSSRNVTDRQLGAIAQSNGLVGVIFCVSNLTNDPNPSNDKPVSAIIDQILYLIDLMGIDHVALGSDFDGATIPVEMGDVTGLPLLFEQLRERGLDQKSLSKIAHENWFRVLKQTWK